MKEKRCKDCGTIENLHQQKNKNNIIVVNNICKNCLKEKVGAVHRNKSVSLEIRQKISKKLMGHKQSLEAIRKTTMFNIGKKRPNIVKEKISKTVSNLHKNNEYVKKRNKIFNDPVFKENFKKIMKENSNNPLVKERKRLAHVGLKHPPVTQEFRDRCRKNAYNCMLKRTLHNTKIEIKIKELLDKNNIKYEHPYFIKDIENKYMADFYLPENNMVIEADGNYWHKYPLGNKIDFIRTKELINKGYKIIRFWESDIHKRITFVEKSILNVCGII
jgi:very-short-patch-repair endonuclease